MLLLLLFYETSEFIKQIKDFPAVTPKYCK